METIKEVSEKIQELWNSNLEIFRMLKDWKGKYDEFILFMEKFFAIVPPELILLLVFVAIMMLLLNSISPTTPRINLTMGVFIFSIIYLYVINVFTGEWRVIRILYIDLFVLVPAYMVEIFGFGKRQWYKFRFKEISSNSGYVKNCLYDIHKSYADLILSETSISDDPEKFLNSLSILERNIKEFREKIRQNISRETGE